MVTIFMQVRMRLGSKRTTQLRRVTEIMLTTTTQAARRTGMKTKTLRPSRRVKKAIALTSWEA
jgi:hypothetical protein